jgi:hypothetical protein
MNQLILDPNDKSVMSEVSGCAVGDEESFKVKGTVRQTDGKFVLDVASVEYAEPEGEGEAETKEEGGMGEEEMPMKSKKNPAMMLVIGGGKGMK